MLRRPPTAIHLTHDDLAAYDLSRSRRLAAARATQQRPANLPRAATASHAPRQTQQHNPYPPYSFPHTPGTDANTSTATASLSAALAPSTPATFFYGANAAQDDDHDNTHDLDDTFASHSQPPTTQSQARAPSPSPARRRLFPPPTTTTPNTDPAAQTSDDIPSMRARLAAASAAADRLGASRRAGVVGMPAAMQGDAGFVDPDVAGAGGAPVTPGQGTRPGSGRDEVRERDEGVGRRRMRDGRGGVAGAGGNGSVGVEEGRAGRRAREERIFGARGEGR